MQLDLFEQARQLTLYSLRLIAYVKMADRKSTAQAVKYLDDNCPNWRRYK